MFTSPLPRRLRQARQASGLSQKNLGVAAGIDEFSASPRMNQYETGKHTPDYLTLKRIAMVLHVSPSYFYADCDTLAELIRLFSRLPSRKQLMLVKQLEKN